MSWANSSQHNEIWRIITIFINWVTKVVNFEAGGSDLWNVITYYCSDLRRATFCNLFKEPSYKNCEYDVKCEKLKYCTSINLAVTKHMLIFILSICWYETSCTVCRTCKCATTLTEWSVTECRPTSCPRSLPRCPRGRPQPSRPPASPHLLHYPHPLYHRSPLLSSPLHRPPFSLLSPPPPSLLPAQMLTTTSGRSLQVCNMSITEQICRHTVSITWIDTWFW